MSDHVGNQEPQLPLEPIERSSQVSVVESTPKISPDTSPRERKRPPAMIACARCDAKWTGMLTSHCGSCHETFTGLTAFETHRTGSHTESGEQIIEKGQTEPRGKRRCLNPADVGLVRSGREYPCWGFPSDGAEWWK